MKNNVMLYVAGVVSILLVIFNIMILLIGNDRGYKEILSYNGNDYVLLEFNESIFTYYYNGNEYLEVEEIYELKHDKWKVIYQEGDLLFLDKDIKSATKYYTDDNNYDWFISFDSGDVVLKKSISISKDELEFLYSLDKADMEKTIKFDDIELFTDILKISKDGFVQGVITLALVEDDWYYKTEVMTDDDREYVIPIDEGLNKKISSLLES